jgi:uncharacterized C2H2 Zn-finger protein
MVLINSEELKRHQTIVHVDKRLQCQSCGKFFDNKDKFEKHIAKIHGNSQQQLDSNFGKKYRFEEQVDDMQSMLLKRIIEEEKARKRTRGPYRKSSSL